MIKPYQQVLFTKKSTNGLLLFCLFFRFVILVLVICTPKLYFCFFNKIMKNAQIFYLWKNLKSDLKKLNSTSSSSPVLSKRLLRSRCLHQQMHPCSGLHVSLTTAQLPTRFSLFLKPISNNMFNAKFTTLVAQYHNIPDPIIRIGIKL